MYLHPEAVRGTLAVIASRSAPRSQVLVTYLPSSPTRAVIGVGTALFSERLRASYERDEMAALLAEYGFEVVRDESSEEWHERWALPEVGLLPAFARTERLVTAVKV